MCLSIALAVGGLLATIAAAATHVKPVIFGLAWQRLPKNFDGSDIVRVFSDTVLGVPPRGEYETSEVYEGRLAAWKNRSVRSSTALKRWMSRRNMMPTVRPSQLRRNRAGFRPDMRIGSR